MEATRSLGPYGITESIFQECIWLNDIVIIGKSAFFLYNAHFPSWGNYVWKGSMCPSKVCRPHASETVKVIRMMNKLFDCMNIRNLSDDAKTRNENKRAYTYPDDKCLNWLTGEFWDYFTAWKENVHDRAGDFSNSELSAMQSSHHTIVGLKLIVQSVVACVRTLLEAGTLFVLTSHFKQDVLEQLFGHFRYRRGHMQNPNVKDVRHMMVKVKATRSVHMSCVCGNTKRQDCNHQREDSLPKRPHFIG